MDEADRMHDKIERLRHRSSTATAQGGQAYGRLVHLAETPYSGQIRRIAQFIASTYNGQAFPFDLFELRGARRGHRRRRTFVPRRAALGPVRPAQPAADGDRRVRAVIEKWGLKWPEAQ